MIKKVITERIWLIMFVLAFLISVTHAGITTIFANKKLRPGPFKDVVASETAGDDEVIKTEPPSSESEEVIPVEPEFKADLIIKAINPGYKNELDEPEADELIELHKTRPGDLDLSGYSLRYTNGSGNDSIIWEFAEGTILHGDSVILRYAKSPPGTIGDATYTSSLALTAGPLELLKDGELIDAVCWTGKKDCYKPFKSNNPTTLVRNLETNKFAHDEKKYDPVYGGADNISWPKLPDEEPGSENPLQKPRCYALEFSEIYSYYENSASEQYIEIYNPTASAIDLSGCAVKYKNKLYNLNGTLNGERYLALSPTELGFTLTKNPSSSNTVGLVDAEGKTIDELVYTHGQKKTAAFALIYNSAGEASWMVTYLRTPGAENTYQKFRTCPAGKVINEATGNCVKASVIEPVADECPPGKYRNPLTNRCKTIQDKAGPTPCAEGYERNPETNRCRKIKSDNSGAEYALVPSTSTDQKTFVALWVVILLVSLGVIYIILQFKTEIVRMFRKIRQRIHHVR